MNSNNSSVSVDFMFTRDTVPTFDWLCRSIDGGPLEWNPAYTGDKFEEMAKATIRRMIPDIALTEIERKELAALRELAAGQCTIQKVIDQLGPMSLWSKAAFEEQVQRRVAAALKEPT